MVGCRAIVGVGRLHDGGVRTSCGVPQEPDRSGYRALAMRSRSRFLKYALVVGPLCVAALGAWARPAAADGTEPQTLPNDLPAIRWIVVERNGQKAVATPAVVDCSKFIMSQRAAARHFEGLAAHIEVGLRPHDRPVAWPV